MVDHLSIQSLGISGGLTITVDIPLMLNVHLQESFKSSRVEDVICIKEHEERGSSTVDTHIPCPPRSPWGVV
jgi:hypothetical protein